jgi:hypothetical protein
MSFLSQVYPNAANLLQKRARVRPPAADCAQSAAGGTKRTSSVREILAEASTVRPDLTAEGNRPARGGIMARA